jgi:hypothetical protein
VTADDAEPNPGKFARFMTRAPRMLSRHLWVWPILGAVVIGMVGYWVRYQVEEATRDELASRLATLRDADVAALRLWFSEQEADAKSFAADIRIQQAVLELVAMSKESTNTPAILAGSAPAQTLTLYLKPLLEAQHYLDFVVVGANRRILASPYPRLVGRPEPPGYEMFMGKVLAGGVAVSRPFVRELTLSQRAEGPTMFVAAPVKDEKGKVQAVLGLRMKPEAEFSQIFSVAHMGETGETYAFDRRGVMLTATRFDYELKKLGLIPDVAEATAILNLRLSDPGELLEPGKPLPQAAQPLDPPVTNSANGGPIRPKRAPRPRDEPALTRMAESATTGHEGVDVRGYRNYRGVKVVGAWTWLPQYGMGVATEVATAEAFQTLYMLREAFLVLFLLLVVSGAGIFGFTLLVERLESSARKSALAAKRLGQYVLVQEIGRGANGMVYRARHSLLRRPVAIKLLSPELTNETTAASFEHEVQMTSQLTHPNTVAIYDYGQTPEGLFYYAMEYLSGIDLDQLVRQFGPQPEGRVIHILRQVCGSLAEAHRIGLIHRDIKPANIVLTRRGGVCDLVKVVDFGLVKGRRQRAGDTRTARAVVGTPHFMSPEAIEKPESVDSRSDLYSVGAVGYWLLTGKTLFDSQEVEELLKLQVSEMPLSPSKRLGQPVPSDLEQLIMRTLAKSPQDRLGSIDEFDDALQRCEASHAWTDPLSEKWWKSNLSGIEISPAVTMAEKTLVIAPRD